MSHLRKILRMNDATVEYVYEDEHGQQFTAHQQPQDPLEGDGHKAEVMIVEQSDLQNDVNESNAPEETTDHADPECRRRDTHHCWGVEQSLKLIETVKEFKDQLGKTGSRKETWQKITKAVRTKGVDVNVQECQNKWKNLIRSYKECIKMKNRSNMRFRYFNEMSDYFGGDTSLLNLEHDYNKTKLTLMPLLSPGNVPGSNTAPPTVTFPPICFTDRQFVEYTNMKREEYAARQKRHDEEMAIRRQELEVQKKKLEVMKKAAMANVPSNKNVNFGKKSKLNNSSNAIKEEMQVYEGDSQRNIEITYQSVPNIQILESMAF